MSSIQRILVHCLFLSTTIITCHAQHWDWAHSFSMVPYTNGAQCVDIDIDTDGNIYAAGDYYGGYMTITGTQAPYAYSGRSFVAKFDNSGNLLLLKTIYDANCLMFAVDQGKNMYVYGMVYFLLDFAGTTLNCDKYLAKIDSAGNEEWVIPINDIWFSDLEVSPNNKIGFLAEFCGTVNLAGDTFISNPGSCDLLVGELNTNGTLEWGTAYGGAGHETALSMCYDNDTNLFVTARFGDTISFGAHTFDLGSNPSENAALVKLN